jgi:hypothetical protein
MVFIPKSTKSWRRQRANVAKVVANPPKESPRVPVRLFTHDLGQQWEIPCCPYCGGSHLHGAGKLGSDPDALLGPRSPHCPDTHGLPNYILMKDETPSG